jgi:hypothetical protein
MNVSNELQVAEEAVARALRATQANDAATGPPRHSEQTDQCPNIARFATVLRFGGKWTAEEANHIASGCRFCQKVFGMFAAAASEAAQAETEYDKLGSDETKIGTKKPGESDDTKLK